MSDWKEKRRIAISALIGAGKSINVIVSDLEVSCSTVLRVKRRLAAGKGAQASPRKKSTPKFTSRVVGGLKKRIRAAPTVPPAGRQGGQRFARGRT